MATEHRSAKNLGRCVPSETRLTTDTLQWRQIPRPCVELIPEPDANSGQRVLKGNFQNRKVNIYKDIFKDL